jgi:CHAT domain-containing protein
MSIVEAPSARRIWGRTFTFSSAVVVAGVAAIMAWQRPNRPHEARQALSVASISQSLAARPMEGRITGYPYALWTRPESQWSLEATTAARAEAGRVLGEPGARQAEQLRGIAHLIGGNARTAAAELETVTASEPGNDTAWSDLAAARYEAAREDRDAVLLTRALAASDRAIELKPQSAEALFNRALALEALGLRVVAAGAWRRYLEVDNTSSWSDEARRHLHEDRHLTRNDRWRAVASQLSNAVAAGSRKDVAAIVAEFPEEARTWAEGEYLGTWGERFLAHDSTSAEALQKARLIGDAVAERSGETLLRDAVAAIDRDPPSLAPAHVIYRRGRMLYAQRKVKDSIPLIREAIERFHAARSPMELVAIYYLANSTVDKEEQEQALEQLSRIPVAEGYKSLKANIQWTQGTALARSGDLYEAVESLRSSARMFDALGERDSAARVRIGLAGALARLGRTEESWQMRRAGFAETSESGTGAVELALDSAMRSEIREKHYDSARALVTVQSEVVTASPRLHFDMLLWKRFLSSGLAGSDSGDFASLHHAAFEISDPYLRAEALDDARFAEALTVRDREPRRARMMLDASVAFWSTHKRPFRLIQALVERASTERMLREDADAVRDLQTAITLITAQGSRIAIDDLRDSFLGASERAFIELADILTARGDYAAALDVVEQARARTLAQRLARRIGEADAPLSAAGIQRALASGVVVAELLVFDDRLVALIADGNGVRGTAVPRSRASLERAALQFTRVMTESERAAPPALSSDLFEALIAPVLAHAETARLLVIVPDPVVEGIPFAALIDHTTGRYAVEDRAIITAPSVTSYIRASQRRPTASGMGVLLVGDPAFAQTGATADLPRLAEADAEVRAIERLYRKTTTLTGTAATRRRVVETIRGYDMIHLATHALVNEREPSQTCLVLAPSDGDNGLLSVRDLAALDLSESPVVVLAGCRTALTGKGRSSLRSLAAAALFAGARSAVATLWDVDDATGREVSVALHRELRSGAGIAEALRTVQLTMLRGPNPTLRSSRAWGAFQVLGSDR